MKEESENRKKERKEEGETKIAMTYNILKYIDTIRI